MKSITRAALVISALVIAALLALKSCDAKRYYWRQKISVVVETPQGLRSASTVLQVTLTDSTKLYANPEAQGVTRNIAGEAVTLEVAPGRYLFALLRGAPSADVVFLPPNTPLLEFVPKLTKLREERQLPQGRYPVLVTFSDIDEPSSVMRVDPGDLSANFGPGYRLDSITLSVTDEPVTRGRVRQLLPWIVKTNFIIPPKQQPRIATNQTIEQKILPSDFVDGNHLKLLREKETGK